MKGKKTLKEFTRIKNDVLEALAMGNFSGLELSILLAVIRKTWGWHKKEDSISLSQFVKMTEKSRRGIVYAINILVNRNALVQSTSLGKTTKYSFNKNYLKWKKRLVQSTSPVQNMVRTSAKYGKKLVQSTSHTKETTKETIQKKDINIFIEEFNLLFERNYKPTTGRIKKLQLRLKAFSLEDILNAIYNLSKSPFHRGVNDRGWMADPDFLIRSDEQIDKWLNVDMEQAKQLSKLNKEANGKSKIRFISEANL